ncbi:MAG: THUMP domain-containing protein [Thermoproteota archaeon]
MPRLLAAFPPGIEDIVRKELEEKIGFNIVFEENPLGVSGKLIVDTPTFRNTWLNRFRSVDSLTEYAGSFKVERSRESLEKIYREIMEVDFPAGLQKASSFRVTCRRRGEHEYSSMEVEKTAGQALVDKYRLKVDLETFEVNVFIEIIDDACFVSLSKEEHSPERYMVFNHPAPLKPSIAYAMIRLAEIKPRMKVLDPMCGGGTIPVETVLAVRGVEAYGFDVSDYFLEGAVLNAEAMGVREKIIFKKVDCRKLSKTLRFKVDRIITDPPYGTRPVARIKPYSLYSKCLLEMMKVLEDDGKIVLITLKPDYVKKISSEIRLNLEHERLVKHGDAYPHIMVLTPSQR